MEIKSQIIMFDIKITKIDKSAKPNEGTFLQTPFWCEFKTRHGWTYNRFNIETKLSADYLEELKAQGCEKSPFTDGNYFKSFELAVLNRSFVKGMFSVIITLLVYKRLSPIIKGTNR